MLCWLHVSDLHLKEGPPYEQQLVLDALISSIERLRGRGRRFDLVFVTGDLAFSGKPGEYAAVGAILDRLIAAAGVDKRRLFVIPGNHDVDRWAGKGLARTLANEDESTEFFGPDHPRPHLAKLRGFVEWHDRYFAGHRRCSPVTACPEPCLVEVADYRVAILPVNTAIFSADNSDHDQLWVGRRWLQGAIADLRSQGDAELTIALHHHPLSWLHDDERSNVSALLQANADVALRGHLHENEVASIDSTGGRCLHLAAGAAYQTRKYPQRALITTADLASGTARILPLRYEDTPREVWVEDAGLFPEHPDHEGVFPLGRGEGRPASAAGQEPRQTIGALIARLLPDADLRRSFRCADLEARCDDDEAGLALIAAILAVEAREEIQVIGRGPQMVDVKTRSYVAAVAKAILRGVSYQRILILDRHLPQNGLLWLLLLERFLALPACRDRVSLHVVTMDSTDLILAFQIVDRRYLHRVERFYQPDEPGASRQAHSLFAIAPSDEIGQALGSYRWRLAKAGEPHNHARLIRVLEKILNDLEPGRRSLTHHWKLVLAVNEFLDGLPVPELPPRGVRFVGCLMPFTFTHLAAERFAEQVAERWRVVPLPFGSLDDAIEQFLNGRLDFVCIPVANTQLGTVVPPLEAPSGLARVEHHGVEVAEIRVPVQFVLAGAHTDCRRWREVVAVDPAYLQVKEHLPEEAVRLPRHLDERAQSNYHAACLAKDDPALVAVTTREAARHLGLHVCAALGDEPNTTTFAVFGRPDGQPTR